MTATNTDFNLLAATPAASFSQGNEVTTISSLPNEVIAIIFNKLSDLLSALRFVGVSRQFNYIAQASESSTPFIKACMLLSPRLISILPDVNNLVTAVKLMLSNGTQMAKRALNRVVGQCHISFLNSAKINKITPDHANFFHYVDAALHIINKFLIKNSLETNFINSICKEFKNNILYQVAEHYSEKPLEEITPELHRDLTNSLKGNLQEKNTINIITKINTLFTENKKNELNKFIKNPEYQKDITEKSFSHACKRWETKKQELEAELKQVKIEQESANNIINTTINNIGEAENNIKNMKELVAKCKNAGKNADLGKEIRKAIEDLSNMRKKLPALKAKQSALNTEQEKIKLALSKIPNLSPEAIETVKKNFAKELYNHFLMLS